MEEQIDKQVNAETVAATSAVDGTNGATAKADGTAEVSDVSSTMEQPPTPEMQQDQPQQPQQLPPGYAVDPATGQVVFVGPVMQQPVQPVYGNPGVVYVQQQPTPEQIAVQQAEAQQRYGQIVHSVEQFIEGETSVSDVVKTLYANTAQDDQLWKGVLVGAAAAVLLTSGPVRDVMGKTLGGVFPGLKGTGQAPADTAAAAKETSKIKPSPEKE